MLRIESMEARLPLSATAMLSAVEPVESAASSAAVVVEEAVAVNPAANPVAVPRIAARALTVCFPVAVSPLQNAVPVPIAARDLAFASGIAWNADVATGLLVNDAGVASAESTSLTASPIGSPTPTGGVGTSSIGVGVIPIGQPAPPVITDFTVTAGMSNVWTFEGEVDYLFPWLLTIDFGGVLEGHETTVLIDGTFSYEVILPSGTTGIVSAQAFTPQSVGSNVAFDWIV
jgi:hypothetical protein